MLPLNEMSTHEHARANLAHGFEFAVHDEIVPTHFA
jgi:hypothetical protein